MMGPGNFAQQTVCRSPLFPAVQSCIAKVCCHWGTLEPKCRSGRANDHCRLHTPPIMHTGSCRTKAETFRELRSFEENFQWFGTTSREAAGHLDEPMMAPLNASRLLDRRQGRLRLNTSCRHQRKAANRGSPSYHFCGDVSLIGTCRAVLTTRTLLSELWSMSVSRIRKNFSASIGWPPAVDC
jgi:hypothetical protein